MNEISIDHYFSLIKNEPEELLSSANEKARKIFGQTITYSRNFFVPITHQCSNRCGYCSFVSDDANSWITLDKYQQLLQQANLAECTEILLTLGERPEIKYESARKFLSENSCNSTIEYVKLFCDLALDEKLLPHSNPGVISFEELEYLKDSNASLGLMLETSSTRLLEKDKAHYNSPSKNPVLRIETIENAGKLKIPFTTGLLIGIGETWKERVESLMILRDISMQYEHIQEIIIQNFNPQPRTPMQNHPPPKENDVLLTVALARLIVDSKVSIQAPPNLNRKRIIDILRSGANDLGGISPLSIDYINPNMTWQEENKLDEELSSANFTLHQRLPVYPQYEKYLSTRIREIIKDKYTNEKTLPS